jgi:CDP-diacylglycerol---serine O-phosphatidyltransferase
MSITKHIPNALTCCNLLCGCIGIIALGYGANGVYLIPWLIWAACIFDFLDGFAARILKVSSPIGKELDSLADMVTFGVLPSLLMCYLLTRAEAGSQSGIIYMPFVGLSLAVFSAIRLAKFNIDERQVDGFIGVPTPANALFIIGLPLFFEHFRLEMSWIFLTVVTLLFSWLMVSPFNLFSLKFKSFGWKGNEVRFTFLAISVLLIGFLREAAVSTIIITYILTSLFMGWRGAGAVSK